MDSKELFNGFDPSKYEAEAQERWGETDGYRQSIRRTRGYTPEDWKRQQAEQGAIYADAAAAMRRGVEPTAPAALEIAERHRLSIDKWFYPCSHAMHAGLADMYEADDRFRASIDAAGSLLDPGPPSHAGRGFSPACPAQSSSAAAAVPKVPAAFFIR